MSVSSPEKTKVYKKKRSSKQSLFSGNTEVKSMFHIFLSNNVGFRVYKRFFILDGSNNNNNN